jgi:hypothetical protein
MAYELPLTSEAGVSRENYMRCKKNLLDNPVTPTLINAISLLLALIE